MSDRVIYKELSYIICGICFKTHNELGRFRSEKTYGDYLEQQFIELKMNYKREFPIPPSFKGEHIRRNIVDFIVEDKIILDLKAKLIISKNDYFQMKRYLQAMNKSLGLIVNFRQLHLYPKRILGGGNL